MRERRRSFRISQLERIAHGKFDSLTKERHSESHHHAGNHPSRRAHERVTTKGDGYHSTHPERKLHSK